jgi:hypothetical protein
MAESEYPQAIDPDLEGRLGRHTHMLLAGGQQAEKDKGVNREAADLGWQFF